MDKRVLKIDAEHSRGWSDEPSARIEIVGHDADGDTIIIKMEKEEAQEFLRLAQALAGNESRTTQQLIEALDQRRTLEAT